MGSYITSSDLYEIFGRSNIRMWADIEATDDDTTIDAAIDAAIAVAERYVLDRLRSSVYAIPLIKTETDGLAMVHDIMATVAGTRLYFARGMRDDSTEDRMQAKRDEADAMIDAYLSGQMEMAAERKADQSSAPAVVGR